ncbi:hypothetical protein [Weissella confusa]|uniref:hypothetical protein n=1 Tax=Weissella confusa TaxID=1583 RepID=UPI00223AAFC2|nr:hypothetical protein [Weissella confusa]MCS9991247.1 hypothetical protein [Weissella confusa]
MSAKPDFQSAVKKHSNKSLEKPLSVLYSDNTEPTDDSSELTFEEFEELIAESPTGSTERLTVVASKELKQLLNVTAKQRGRSKGGAKGIFQEALTDWYKEHWSEFVVTKNDLK